MKRAMDKSINAIKTVINRSPKMKREKVAMDEAALEPSASIGNDEESTEPESGPECSGIADDISDSVSTTPSQTISEFPEDVDDTSEASRSHDSEVEDIEESSWRGCSMHDLNAKLSISPPQRGSKSQTIFVKWPKTERETIFVPFPAKYQRLDDGRNEGFVDMPFSEESMFPVPAKSETTGGESLTKILESRWKLIQEALKKPMKSSNDIQARILAYNRARQVNFSGLHHFFEEELDPEEEEYKTFFKQILPNMAKLCLELPKLVTQPIPLLGKKWDYSLTFSQRQIASLLANAFFCTFPKRISAKSKYSNYPSINFNRLFSDLDDQHGIQGEKLKCLINYFRFISDKKPEEETLVTFHRHFIPYHSLPKWEASRKKLTKLHIDAKGTIEDDGFGMLQVDFANAFVGGGVLGHGCVQEEIRFLISPELILSRLFTERLSFNECLVVTGFERFSKYTGYSSSFKFAGPYKDETPIHEGSKHRKTRLVAIDALPPGHSLSQYSPKNVKRELDKAFVGFKNYDLNIKEPVAVATGNWGCGAFGGDPQLKSLIQILAASEARRDVAYFTFSNRKLRDQIHEMHDLLQSRELTVGQIYQLICKYHLQRTRKSTLYGFIQKQLEYDADTDEEDKEDGASPKRNSIDEKTIDEVSTEDEATMAESESEETSAKELQTNASSEELSLTKEMIAEQDNPGQEILPKSGKSVDSCVIDEQDESMDVDDAELLKIYGSANASKTNMNGSGTDK